MYDFLDTVSTIELRKVIKAELKDSSKVDDSCGRESIYRILFSIFGYNILSEKKIRRLMLRSLADDKFVEFIKFFDIDSDDRLENIISLNLLKWQYKSKIVKIFKKFFAIPGEYLPQKKDKSSKIETFSSCESLDELFDYQFEISSKIKDFIDSDDKSTIVQMPTGSGKTRTALDSIVETCIHQKNKIVWLAHSEELLEQAIQTLKKIWGQKGDRDIKIGRLWGSISPDEEHLDSDFLFIGFMKFVGLKKDFDFFSEIKNNVNIFVVDEAHKSVSTSLGRIIEELLENSSSKIIGLTATPGRSFEDSFENRKLVGLYKRIITSDILGNNAISLLQSRGILSNLIPLEYKHGVDINLSENDVNFSIEKGDMSKKILKRLSENDDRNNLIVRYIKEEYEKQNKTLVFCCNVEHSRRIAIMLAQEGVVSSSVDYKIKPNARKSIVEDFRSGKLQVLLNFGIFSTGLDIPDIDTVFITRPTSSIVLYSQMIGRGLRGEKVGGTKECRLINVRDNFQNFGDIDEVYNYFENNWNINGPE